MERSRLALRLKKASAFPIWLLQGAAGCGKSVALRDALARDVRPYVIFDVGPEHATLPRFVQGLAEALYAQAPGARISFTSAFDRAILSDHPERSLAIWLSEHIKGLDLTIAIDNAHHADALLVQSFLARLIDRPATDVRWVIACRSLDDLPVASWLAAGRTGLPIEEDELAYTADEVLALAAHRHVTLEEFDARCMLVQTIGWATGVAYLLQMRASGRSHFGEVRAYGPIIEKILADCDPHAVRLLASAVVLPDLSPGLLDAVGGHGLIRMMDDLRASAPFLFVETTKTLRFHGLFRDSLRVRLGSPDATDIRKAIDRVVAVLLADKRYADVLSLYFEGHLSECVQILDSYGMELVEQGRADLVDAALGRVQQSELELPPMVIALRAIVDSRLGRVDTAEAWFTQALARAGNDARMIEIKYLFACDLLRRDRLDCIPLLQEHVDDSRLSPTLRASIRSALAEALQLANDGMGARAEITAALDLERTVGDPDLHARILARAAYVFLYQDDYDLAHSYAQAAAKAATSASLYNVATGAYSVLYVVAFDREDVEEALGALDMLLESCLKSGNLPVQFYCLACRFEIEMERNNVEAIRGIDETLQSFDIYLGGAVSDEAFLPGEALRSGAHGDFERAYRLLYPTATHQAGDERIAQRWAEVALYAAGANRHVEATEAADNAMAAIARCGTSSARSARARLYAGLALALIGRGNEADSLLAGVREKPGLPDRIGTLALGFEAMCKYARGEDNRHEIVRALRDMHERDCGGIARMLESLPSRLFAEMVT